jgi:toluene monooxygenase electron transfer component
VERICLSPEPASASFVTRVQIDNGPFFEVRGNDSLLKAALRAGVGFPYECSVGSCGSCKFDLLSGEVSTLWNEAPGLTHRDRQRGKRLGCQSVPQGDLRVRVRTAPEFEPAIRPKVVAAELVRARVLTHDMTEFTFRSACAADFLPGQYALVQLPGISAQRAYSMSNQPNAEGAWQFIIRRVPHGVLTRHMFDQVNVGDTLMIDGPYGLAFLRPITRDMVCIAGGSGLAPMVSIASAAAPLLASHGRRLHFYYGGRAPRDLAAASMLSGLSGFGEQFRYVEAVSQPEAADDWRGHVGFIHELAEQELGDALADCEVYFAGPSPMVQATLDTLMLKRGVPFAQIHYDRFS